MTKNKEKEYDRWYIDSGATSYMSPCLEFFENYKPLTQNAGSVTIASGDKLPAVGTGDIAISGIPNINKVKDVIFVPGLHCNLISVKKSVDKGYTIIFDKRGCNFYKNIDVTYTANSILQGSYKGGLYSLDLNPTINQSFTALDVV